MALIGTLEGQRMRHRLGSPAVLPDDYTGQENNRAIMTTDWPRIYIADPIATRARYAEANAGSISPEDDPTVESFMRSHGMSFVENNPNQFHPVDTIVYAQPDPPTLTPIAPAESTAIAQQTDYGNPVTIAQPSPVTVLPSFVQPDPPTLTPYTEAESAAIAEQSRRASDLPADKVSTEQACGGRAGSITCGPANATGGGRGNIASTVPDTLPVATSSKALPILAAIAAYFLIKG